MILYFTTILFISIVQCGLPVHPYISQATDISCESTADCLAYYGNDWCQQGVVCLKQRCHTIPFHPCKQGEVCLSEEKKCAERMCHHHGDCDDGIFCNGVERCVDSRCVIDTRFDCSYGICTEHDRSCHMPLGLKEFKGQQQQQRQLVVKTITVKDTNSTTESDDWTTTVWVIVGLSAGFFAIVLVILLISRASRPSQPVIVFDRETKTGGEVYTKQMFYS